MTYQCTTLVQEKKNPGRLMHFTSLIDYWKFNSMLHACWWLTLPVSSMLMDFRKQKGCLENEQVIGELVVNNLKGVLAGSSPN